MLREKKGITQDELAIKLGYTSRSTIAKIESGKADITQTKVKELAKILNTTTGYLIDGINTTSSNNQINQEEKDLLAKFNKLNTLGKNEAKKRVEELTQIDKYTINNIDEELSITEEDIQEIKLYEIPASAGTGSFIDCDVPYEIKKVDLTVAPQARRADFALYVRGDSMEPDYYDGDIVFVREQPKVDNGQIGIFIYDDVSYIKKYSIQDDGIYLISLNDKYKPIKVDKNTPFRTCGLVL